MRAEGGRSRNEAPGNTGSAHLLEHMIFNKWTENFGKAKGHKTFQEVLYEASADFSSTRLWIYDDGEMSLTGAFRYVWKALSGGASMLKPGDPAPDFEATAHDGSRVKLSGLRGKKVVLWFYPKAGTSG